MSSTIKRGTLVKGAGPTRNRCETEFLKKAWHTVQRKESGRP